MDIEYKLEEAREEFYLAQYERASKRQLAAAWKRLLTAYAAWQQHQKERDPTFIIKLPPTKMPTLY